MLLLICAWGALIAVSAVVGLTLFPVHVVEQPGDRALAATWLGLMVVAVGALALSLVSPLTPTAVVSATSAALVGCLSVPRTRAALRTLLRCATPAALLALSLLLVGIAAFGSQRRSWGDVGLYHAQAIGWLSDFGTVPGLALIHNRFGSASSWFALAATFDHGPFDGRADPVLGGLVLLLVCLHLALSAARVLERRSALADRFMIAASPLLLPYLSGKVAVSPSPDAAVASLAVVTAWLFLALPAPDPGSGDGNRHRLDAAALPLVLGIGAVTAKLSGIPIAAAAVLYFALRYRRGVPWRPVTAIGLPGLMLVLLLGANTVLSGCPLFPSEKLCFELPWAVDSTGAPTYASVIQEFSRWYGSPPEEQSSVGLVRDWLEQNRKINAMIGLSVACLLIGARARNRSERSAIAAAVALFAIGAPFVLWLASLDRFLVGYCAVVPALVVATRGDRLFRLAGRLPVRSASWSVVLPAALLSAGIVGRTPLLNGRGPFDNGAISDLIVLDRVEPLAPTPLPADPAVIEKSVNDVGYTVPLSKGRCWTAAPPCTPGLTVPDIRLRDRRRGLRAGFERASGALPATARGTPVGSRVLSNQDVDR